MASMSGISEVDTPEAYRLSVRLARPADGKGTWREDERMFSFSSFGGFVLIVAR